METVTLFRQGALVTRTGVVTVAAGTTDLRFAGLEQGVDEATVQLAVDPSVSVLTLASYNEPGRDGPEPDSLTPLRAALDSLRLDTALLGAERAGYLEERRLLAANRAFPAETVVADYPAAVSAAAALYRERTRAISTALVRIDRAAAELAERLAVLEARVAVVRPAPRTDAGVVAARLLAAQAGTFAFELTYLVRDAGWVPDYDLFVDPEAAGEGVDLVLVGKVQQATGVDWTGVDLTLSTGDPNRLLRAPTLVANRIGAPPGAARNRSQLDAEIGASYAVQGQATRPLRSVGGQLTDGYGEPLIGANIQMVGTSAGTVSDMDGRYRLEVPPTAQYPPTLVYSHIGYGSFSVSAHSVSVDVVLRESGVALDEVVVAGYAAGVDMSNRPAPPPPPATFAAESEQLTTRTYALERPFDLPADGRPYAVRLTAYPLTLALRYRAVPKLDPAAYLEGLVTGWDTLGLIAGTVRLHLGGRYLGTDYIDPSSGTSDTLTFALGPDAGVVVERRVTEDVVDRRRLTGRRDYARAYAITVRNTRRLPVSLRIEDQVPVSARDEVEVELTERSNGTFDPETGTLVWELTLPPGTMRELRVGYDLSVPREVAVLRR